MRATERLSSLRGTNTFAVVGETSPWPFLTFLKRILFDFFFDGTIFISYFVGALLAVIFFFWYGVFGSHGYHTFAPFVVTIIGFYYYPMYVSWLRDLCYLAILPIRKLLNWLQKPAQQLTIDMTEHTRREAK